MKKEIFKAVVLFSIVMLAVMFVGLFKGYIVGTQPGTCVNTQDCPQTLNWYWKKTGKIYTLSDPYCRISQPYQNEGQCLYTKCVSENCFGEICNYVVCSPISNKKNICGNGICEKNEHSYDCPADCWCPIYGYTKNRRCIGNTLVYDLFYGGYQNGKCIEDWREKRYDCSKDGKICINGKCVQSTTTTIPKIKPCNSNKDCGEIKVDRYCEKNKIIEEKEFIKCMKYPYNAIWSWTYGICDTKTTKTKSVVEYCSGICENGQCVSKYKNKFDKFCEDMKIAGRFCSNDGRYLITCANKKAFKYKDCWELKDPIISKKGKCVADLLSDAKCVIEDEWKCENDVDCKSIGADVCVDGKCMSKVGKECERNEDCVKKYKSCNYVCDMGNCKVVNLDIEKIKQEKGLCENAKFVDYEDGKEIYKEVCIFDLSDCSGIEQKCGKNEKLVDGKCVCMDGYYRILDACYPYKNVITTAGLGITSIVGLIIVLFVLILMLILIRRR